MSDEKLDVMFFCLGNICRSPLAEALFSHKLERRGLDQTVRVESAGTSSYHVGESPDPGSQRVARERLGRDISHQRSQQLRSEHVHSFDHLVAMDRSNRRRARELVDDPPDIVLVREFDPAADDDLDVPDPYGAKDEQFGLVYDILDRSLDAYLEHLVDRHDHLDPTA